MIVHNIKVNFLDKYYMFYDWLSEDKIETLPKLKVYKVSSKVLNDFINYKIKLLDIKCLGNGKSLLFIDDISSVVINFSDNGTSIFKSSLLLDDENKVNNYCGTIKTSYFAYDKKSKEINSKDLRANEIIRKTIKEELIKLEEKEDSFKASYLYYLWFKKTNVSNKRMINDMLSKIDSPITKEEQEIYNLIKNSYKLV